MSAVGSLALICAVGLGWWYKDIRDKTSADQEDYLELSKKASRAETKARETQDKLLDREDELVALRKKRDKMKGQLSEDSSDKLGLLANATSVLRAQADAPWRVLAYLSYALSSVGEDRDEQERQALGTDLQPSRLTIGEMSIRAGVVTITGEGLFEEDVDRLVKRLRASGYLARVKRKQTVRKIDPKVKKAYWAFELTAELRYPEVIELDEDDL